MNASYENEVFLASLIGSVVFFILVAFSISYLVTYKRKRKEHFIQMKEFKKQFEAQLLQSQVEVQEQTFQQIGKELHDNVGQLLSSARLLLGLTERNMKTPPDTLITANETLAEAILQLRLLSKSLDKEWLEQFSFSDNLNNEITRINAGKQIRAEYNQESDILLEAQKQIILFRIVQEAIQNAIKHAAPSNIMVTASLCEDKHIITITDDGTGFSFQKKNTGMGLDNMKHRTRLLGGTITWHSLQNTGTSVTITLPNNND